MSSSAAFPLSDEQLASCTVHSRTEILHLMRQIQQRRLLVNLDMPGTRQIVVTSVILDSARGDALNQELMAGKTAEFITHLDGVSITFSTGAVHLIEYDKLPSLRIALPKSLVRLQRREHFRVPLPIANPVKCIVPSRSDEDREPISAHIVDIGCGGIAIVERGGRLGSETGQILTGCRLLLPNAEPIVTTLEVRNSAQVRLQNGAFQTRLGCKFIDLPITMANQMQRFVMNIERERRDSL